MDFYGLVPAVAQAFFGRFHSLRPVQEAAIPIILQGRNVTISSGTGSGKTEAALAPMISRYWREIATASGPTIIYVVPTKALVNDLEKRLDYPLTTVGLKVGIRHGDRDDLKKSVKPAVLLTTPESLDVLLFRGDTALRSVRALVVDEVHLFYNTQRGLHLSILVRRLQKATGQDLQWAALSATVGNHRDVCGFLFGAGDDVAYVEGGLARTIDAAVRRVAGGEGLTALVRRLTADRPMKVLVFASSRRDCEELVGSLSTDDRLRRFTFAHYSSLSNDVRLHVENQFASLDTAICVATSTLELGIDIGDIDLVILWGIPGGVESFLQRIGRGNRRQNKTNVLCCVTGARLETTEALRFWALTRAAEAGEMPTRTPYELYGALAQQILSSIASNGGRFTSIRDLHEMVQLREYATRDVVEAISSELASRGYLQPHGFKSQYGADEKLHALVDLRLIYGNFPISSQEVEVRDGSQVLGAVPVANLLQIRPGALVRFAGRTWRVTKASTSGIEVELAPMPKNALDFTYGGQGILCDAFVIQKSWELVHSEEPSETLFSHQNWDGFRNLVAMLRSTCRWDQVPFVRNADGFVYLTFGGMLVNKAVGLASGGEGSFKADDFTLSSHVRVDWASIPSTPEGYSGSSASILKESTAQSLFQTLLPSELQLSEFRESWFRDNTIARILTRLSSATPVLVGKELVAPFLGGRQ